MDPSILRIPSLASVHRNKASEVVLRFDGRAAREASAFLFHPDQKVENNTDGSLTVCFKAGGIDEMCWHLFTWGESVTVEKPVRLPRRLARMCASLVAHRSRVRRTGFGYGIR